MARTKNAKVPEVGSEAPEFNLPSAQGGSLRLGMRTATGPVIVAFFRGAWSEDDISFFKKLAEREDEINLAIGDVVGVGMVESAAAREFVKASGMKSYILYDYAKTATPAWGLLEKDKENGEYARPATFLIDSDNKVVEAWMDGRPNPDDLLAKVSEITGLPKPLEEDDGEEKPKKGRAAKKADAESAESESSEASGKPDREKPSPEEREKRRAERKAAREPGADAKPAAESGEEKTKAGATKSGGEAGSEAEAEGASTEGAERGESESGDGSGGSGGSGEEGGEARSGKKEGKEGG